MQEITVCMILGKKKIKNIYFEKIKPSILMRVIINMLRQELFLFGKLKYFHKENTWYVG